MQPLYNFLKMCNLCIAITINLFLPMSRWCLKVIGISKHLVWKCQNLSGNNDELLYNFLKMCKIAIQNLGERDEMYHAAMKLYNFLKMCNLCIAITINLFLPMSRWCLEVVGISKHLVWCHIFGKCQNLSGNNEKHNWAVIQFLKMCNLCITITINLVLPLSRWCLEVAEISKTSSLVSYFWKMSKFRWKWWNVSCSHYTIF